MSKTDVIDYAEICNHAKRKRECPACAELTALREENERLRELVKESFQVEPATTCGDCMGYEYGKDLPDYSGFYPGKCNIEDVSDELPYDAVPPDWCPLRKNPVLIVLKTE
jgi:hypothetical protein